MLPSCCVQPLLDVVKAAACTQLCRRSIISRCSSESREALAASPQGDHSQTQTPTLSLPPIASSITQVPPPQLRRRLQQQQNPAGGGGGGQLDEWKVDAVEPAGGSSPAGGQQQQQQAGAAKGAPAPPPPASPAPAAPAAGGRGGNAAAPSPAPAAASPAAAALSPAAAAPPLAELCRLTGAQLVGADGRLKYDIAFKEGDTMLPAGTPVALAPAAAPQPAALDDDEVAIGGAPEDDGGSSSEDAGDDAGDTPQRRQQEVNGSGGKAAPPWALPLLPRPPAPAPVPLALLVAMGARPLACRGLPLLPLLPLLSPAPPSPAPGKQQPQPSPPPSPSPPKQQQGELFLRTPPVAALAFDADLDSRAWPEVPPSFLGISHEWPYIEELANIPSYVALMRLLASYGAGAPVVRVGGGSTDHQRAPPGQYVWDSLNRLRAATGATFILGLNFEARDAGLAARQMRAAEARLRPGSVAYYELGNEPNYYQNVDGRSGNDYIGCCFVRDWDKMATALSCPGGAGRDAPTCTRGRLAGPVWGHINVRPQTIDWFLQ